MARKARIHVHGVIQQIMSRGIEGKNIIADDEDRTTFFHILAELLSVAGHKCYAWVLLPNLLDISLWS